MQLFVRSIDHYTKFLLKENIRIQFIGDLKTLNPKLLGKMLAIQENTQHLTKISLTIAINYGSRDEITRTLQKILTMGLKHCSWEIIQQQLDTAKLPDVDLFIRTSGEQRLSNFLLLQAAYAELIFTKKFWPEFTSHDFEDMLQIFSQRKRNFGQ
jgi:undecaprenyl diphosphate synthase